MLDSGAGEGGFGAAGSNFGAGGRTIGVVSAVQLVKDSNREKATREWFIDLGNMYFPPLERVLGREACGFTPSSAYGQRVPMMKKPEQDTRNMRAFVRSQSRASLPDLVVGQAKARKYFVNLPVMGGRLIKKEK